MGKKEKSLTPEEKKRIWQAISTKTACDDKPAQEVIQDSFRGNEDAYLLVMAKWHNVQLDTN